MKLRVIINKIFSTIESRTWPFKVSWLRTIYFNFRSMPISLALKLPVLIYTHTEFQTLSGRVEIIGDVRHGMVRIGKREDRGTGVTTIRNHGVIRFRDGVTIMQGCDIYVGAEGCLEIGKGVRLRENVFLYVSKYVSIGDFCGIAYQTTISDDDFHFVIDSSSGIVADSKAPIVIGNRNWIGSRTVIKKGTITPDNTIVASSYSLLDRDYRNSVPEYSVIGGVPARLLRKDLRRIFAAETDAALMEHFSETSSPFVFDVERGNIDKFCFGSGLMGDDPKDS